MLFTGAALPPMSLTKDYAAETVLYGEAVCPTLLPGSEEDSLAVRWMAYAGRPVELHFGPDDGSGVLPEEHEVLAVPYARSGAFQKLFAYHVELKPEPGDYLYGLAPAGEKSPETLYPLRRRTEGSFRVVATSDSHISNAAQAQLLESAMRAGAGERGADLIVHAGDLNEDTAADPHVIFRNTPIVRSVPVLAVPGNHDRSLAVNDCATMPHRDKKTGDFWTIQGRVLFVGLNVEHAVPADHARFVRSTVTEQRENCDWVVAVLHYSMMSAGPHGRDRTVVNLRRELEPVFAELDVDLALSGHDHEYSRSLPIGADGARTDADPDTVEKKPGETVYICLPTATGTKFYERVIQPDYPPAANALKFQRGFVTADFTAGEITVTAWNAETGEEEDSFVVRRGGEKNG